MVATTLFSANLAPLVVEDANTIAQRNGTNKQAFYLYGTYTSSVSFERLEIALTGSDYIIQTRKGASAGNARQIYFGIDNTVHWVLDNSAGNWSSVAGEFVKCAGYRLNSGNFNAQTGTTYTLVAADNGKTVTLNNASAITLTVPSGLGQGFSCTLIQLGAGQVSVAASSTTINSYNSLVKITGQHGVASLISYATDVFNLSGNLSA